jgi:hypothetical protein
MTYSQPASAWLALTCVTACVACSVETTSGGHFSVESGISRSKLLSALTAAEAQTLCQSSVRSTLTFFESHETLQYACTLTGALDAIVLDGSPHIDRAKCEEARRECLSLPEPESIDPPDCATLISIPPETCTATVGDYEICLEGTFQMFLNDWSGQTCRSLANRRFERGIGGNVDGPDQVLGCSIVRRDCPMLPWPSVEGAFGRANERAAALREARAAAR